MYTFDIGIVGAGKITSSTHLPVLANMERADVQYVADVDKTQVASLARSYDIEAVVTDDPEDLPACEVALLATPVGVRAGYVEEFGGRGIPVFSEKPFALDTETHEQFVNRVGTVSCNYLRLCFGSTQALSRIVEHSPFGPVERVEVSEGGIVGATGRSQDTYQTDASLSGGGVLVERGSHMMSQLVHVLDADRVDVDRAKVISDDGYDVDVSATLTAVIGDRDVPVEFDLSRTRPVGNKLQVVFEHATVEMPIDEPEGELAITCDGTEICTVRADKRWAETFAQSAYLRWRQFLSKLGPDDEYPEKMATGYEVTNLIESLYGAAEEVEL